MLEVAAELVNSILLLCILITLIKRRNDASVIDIRNESRGTVDEQSPRQVVVDSSEIIISASQAVINAKKVVVEAEEVLRQEQEEDDKL